MKSMNLNVRVKGGLQDFVTANIGDDGLYDNASEYIRHLIRKDMARAEQEAFQAKRAFLVNAFAQPDETYGAVTLANVVDRNTSGT